LLSRRLSAASTAPEPSAPAAARKATITIHAGAIAAHIHTSNGSLAVKAQAFLIPISDAVTGPLAGAARGSPAGAALRRRNGSALSHTAVARTAGHSSATSCQIVALGRPLASSALPKTALGRDSPG
jgi:hypothetical protein